MGRKLETLGLAKHGFRLSGMAASEIVPAKVKSGAHAFRTVKVLLRPLV
jgi:hypothetical protein